MDIKATAAGIAKAVLDNTEGYGSWVLHGKKNNRIVQDDDLAKNLSVGDVIYCFDTDNMEFEQDVVVYVDKHGVAYSVWEFYDNQAPGLKVVWNSWAKTKREALLALPCDIKTVLQEAIAEL
jgi:hypothetical protein